MIFETLYWREPLCLLLVLLPGFIIFFSYYLQKNNWKKIADSELLPWIKIYSHSSSQRGVRILLSIAWLMFCIALAGPRTLQWIPPSLKSESAVVVVIDFSSSMMAVDDRLDRITQSQLLLKQWLKHRFKHKLKIAPEDLNLGLIIYAGHSHTLLMPTSDTVIIKHYIDQLHQFRPPTLGNNLASSLQAASDMLKNFTGDKRILLLTDGDLGEKASQYALESTSLIKSQPIELIVIGMGQLEAVRIPLSERSFLTVNGKVIVSRRQVTWLKQFSEMANGQYYHSESSSQLKLTDLINLSDYRIEPKNNQSVIWNEWFFIPLLIGILITLIALHFSGKTSGKSIAVALIFFLNGCNSSNFDEQNVTKRIKQIDNAIILGDYSQVQNLSHDSDANSHNMLSVEQNEYIRFSEGVACYRLKDYLCAQQSFASIAWASSDKKIQAMAIFNLANSHFKLGDYEQASVLFSDADLLGISRNKTRINQEFSDSLADAVKRHIADIARTKQRAQWLSSAHQLPDELQDRIAEGIYFSQPEKKIKTYFSALSSEEQQRLLDVGVKRRLRQSKSHTQLTTEFWVPTKQGELQNEQLKQKTSSLLNDVMAFEAGLHYVPGEPVEIKGLRPW